jgi:K+-transporting ATPase A subunit
MSGQSKKKKKKKKENILKHTWSIHFSGILCREIQVIGGLVFLPQTKGKSKI